MATVRRVFFRHRKKFFIGACVCLLMCFMAQIMLPGADSKGIKRHEPRDHGIASKKTDFSRERLRLRQWTLAAKSHGCQPKKSIVYIKMIKCASTTLASMMRRYGYIHNLSFVLPIGNKIYLGWPYPLETMYYRGLNSKQFNILTEHVMFDEETFTDLMPSDAVYVTSLREPFSQFKSMFNYYNLANIIKISAENPLAEYLHNVSYYDSVYTSPGASKLRFCIPNGLSMSKNLMSFNLGFPTGFQGEVIDQSNDYKFIRKWLDKIHHRFNLVIIVEYLYESLVLLRRLMCWSLIDILHYNLNVGSYTYKETNSLQLANIYKQWSSVDYLLYGHFNRTLWDKIKAQTDDFWQEVQYFKNLVERVSQFCQDLPEEENLPTEKILTIPASLWNREFIVTVDYCQLLQSELLEEVKQDYDKATNNSKKPNPKKFFC